MANVKYFRTTGALWNLDKLKAEIQAALGQAVTAVVSDDGQTLEIEYTVPGAESIIDQVVQQHIATSSFTVQTPDGQQFTNYGSFFYGTGTIDGGDATGIWGGYPAKEYPAGSGTFYLFMTLSAGTLQTGIDTIGAQKSGGGNVVLDSVGILFLAQVIPSAPSAGQVRLYANSSNLLSYELSNGHNGPLATGAFGQTNSFNTSVSAEAFLGGSLQPGTLGTLGCLRVRGSVIFESDNGSQTIIITWNFGGYSISRTSGSVGPSTTTKRHLEIEVWTYNDQATGTQKHIIHWTDWNNTTAGTFSAAATDTAAWDTSSVDTSSPVTYTLTGTMSASDASIKFRSIQSIDGPRADI